MRQTSAGEQGIHTTYSSVVAKCNGPPLSKIRRNCCRKTSTESSSSNSKYRSNTKVDGKDDYQDSQSNRIEGWTPVVSGTPFGKFNGQLVARRRSKLMVGTPGAKQRILVDHEAEAQRLGQSNLLKVGLPL